MPKPTSTPQLTPADIPLTWLKISSGQEFTRDTVTDVGFGPKDASLLYLGTQYSGVYKSNDGGLTWEPAKNPQVKTTSNIPDEPQWKDPLNKNIFFRVYSGSNPSLHFVVLQKSTDDGKTWLAIKDLTSRPYTIAFDAQNDQIYYFGETRSLSKTTDGGQNWKKLYVFPTDFISHIQLSPQDPQTVFVGTQGLFISNNGGKSWQDRSSGIGATRLEIMLSPNHSAIYILEKDYQESRTNYAPGVSFNRQRNHMAAHTK